MPYIRECISHFRWCLDFYRHRQSMSVDLTSDDTKWFQLTQTPFGKVKRLAETREEIAVQKQRQIEAESAHTIKEHNYPGTVE